MIYVVWLQKTKQKANTFYVTASIKLKKNLIIKNLLFVNMQQEELGKVAGIPVTSLSGI